MWHLLFNLAWVGPKVIQIPVVIAIVQRRLWKEFPFFLSFLIFQIARTAVLFSLRSWPLIYTYIYWITEALEAPIALCVIYEIFACALKPYPSLARLTRVLFFWALIVLVLITLGAASAAPVNNEQVNSKHELAQVIYTLKRSIAIIEVGLLALLFFFIKTFAIPWRHYLTGTMLGIALIGCVDLTTWLARTHWGEGVAYITNWALVINADFVTFIWVSYFVLPRKQPVSIRPVPVSPLREWDDSLREILAMRGISGG